MHAGQEPLAPFRVREDARLTQELAYCVPLGLPHSEFLTWHEDDQDKALAWLHEQNSKCRRCRTRPEEWDPKQGGSRWAYVVEIDRCSGCELLDQAQRDLAKMEDTHGIQMRLEPNEDDPVEDEVSV